MAMAAWDVMASALFALTLLMVIYLSVFRRSPPPLPPLD
jgi:hypothetical protein